MWLIISQRQLHSQSTAATSKYLLRAPENEVKAYFIYLLRVTTVSTSTPSETIALSQLSYLLKFYTLTTVSRIFTTPISSLPSPVSSQLPYPHYHLTPVSSQHPYPHSRLLYLLNFNIFLPSNMSNCRDKYIIAENQRLMREVWENVMAVIRMLYHIDLSASENFRTNQIYYKKTILKTRTLLHQPTSIQRQKRSWRSWSPLA